MSSLGRLPVEAQASSLVSFLAQAQHILPLPIALEISAAMRSTDEPPPRFLQVALAGYGIRIKYSSCLKAVALMDGFQGHVSRPRPVWLTAHYMFDTPAFTPRVKRHSKIQDATADLCLQLAGILSRAGERPYGYVNRADDYVEFIFVGKPLVGARYILARKEPDDSPSKIDEQSTLRAIERVRRLIEGQFGGWLDGAAQVPGTNSARLCLIKDGVQLMTGAESSILAIYERDEGYERQVMSSMMRRSGESVRYQVCSVSGDGKPIPIDDKLAERMGQRLATFHRVNRTELAAFIDEKHKEQFQGGFGVDAINVGRLNELLAARNISTEQVAGMVQMDAASWSSALARLQLSRETLFKLTEGLGLPSANDLYFDSRRPISQFVDGKQMDEWMRSFEHLRLVVSETARLSPLAQRLIERLQRLDRRADNSVVLKEVYSQAKAGGLQFTVKVERRFVRDLPITRERLALVGELSLWDMKFFDALPKGKDRADADPAATQAWIEMKDANLSSLNSVEITANDLIALQTEITQRCREGKKQGWETATLASAKVFKQTTNPAHTAQAATLRVTALGRLIRRGTVREWVGFPDKSADMESIPLNLLEAAARCPLIRTGELAEGNIEFSFDIPSFRRLAVEFAKRG
ncbi:hypothetical protein P3T20_004050 [Paraburkholderia sp. GAS206C]|uniref:hypothetical protein n=1 Tax=unclassified Paraburkholderia TaxID=2615204 RepID=UPI003D1F9F97